MAMNPEERYYFVFIVSQYRPTNKVRTARECMLRTDTNLIVLRHAAKLDLPEKALLKMHGVLSPLEI